MQVNTCNYLNDFCYVPSSTTYNSTYVFIGYTNGDRFLGIIISRRSHRCAGLQNFSSKSSELESIQECRYGNNYIVKLGLVLYCFSPKPKSHTFQDKGNIAEQRLNMAFTVNIRMSNISAYKQCYLVMKYMHITIWHYKPRSSNCN